MVYIKKAVKILLGISLVTGFLSNGFKGVQAQILTDTQRIWDFATGVEGWQFDQSWAGEGYQGVSECVHDDEKEMLKVNLDFSKDTANGWSQPGISVPLGAGFDYSSYTALSFDLYYDEAAFSIGQLTFKVASGNVFQDQMAGLFDLTSEVVTGTLKKATVEFEIDASYAASENPDMLMLLIVGNNTDYQGDLWFDNIRLYAPEVQDDYVDATVSAATSIRMATTGTGLILNDQTIAYASQVQLADPKADEATVNLYQYLKAVGQGDAVIYGHMEDTVLKAGTALLSESDTKDLTGSIAGLDGLDCGNLFAGFAAKYNASHPGSNQIPETTQGNVQAAALLTNESLHQGSMMTLSAHMPNFAYAALKDAGASKSYDRYDYTAADSYNLKGDVMNQILPGGLYHDQFVSYLDLIGEYANQIDGPLLFRPFHENTGSWFWWGKAFCDEETYKSVFKYTVEYLRDVLGVHNLLYVYGPGSEAASLEEYGERYPGDEYVDIIGFDTYDNNPISDEAGYTFQTNLENTVKLTDEFAKVHGKLFAVSEIGIANMQDTGNLRPQWFSEIMDIVTKPEYDCSYFMTWTNYSNHSFYTPYVAIKNEDGTLHGHELMDPFIEFYNNEKSVFASDQKDILAGSITTAQLVPWDQTSGYITAPIATTRILGATTITARLNQEDVPATISVVGVDGEIPLATTVIGNIAHAKLGEQLIQELKEVPDGKIRLTCQGKILQEISVIFNIPKPVEDPLVVDDFETYYGENAMLGSNWAINKDSGSNLELSLVENPKLQGNYALRFTYDESSTGWAGATIAKEADWSSANALQFWVIPDCQNQKTVIQINTADGSYEAYLNTYDNYATATGPLLVIIPFNDFIDKTTKTPLTSTAAKSIASFGLWMNAIGDSLAIANGRVGGTIYYDEIKAITSLKTEATFATGQEVAIDQMTVTKLEKVVAKALELDKKDYSKESWKAFKTVLKKAQKTLKEKQSSKEELYQAWIYLIEKTDDLETIF